MSVLKSIFFDFSKEDTAYLTHSFHPYPAKFPPQLPAFILKEFAKRGFIIFDPFVGSGTTLVEAKLLELNATGVDINPLACLVSKVKATPLSPDKLALVDVVQRKLLNESFRWQMGLPQEMEAPKFEGLAHWFQENVVQELALIKKTVCSVGDPDVKDFLSVILSSIIVRVSNQESDTRFAAIRKDIPDGFTVNLFLERMEDYTKRMKEFWTIAGKIKSSVSVFNLDSRDLTAIPSAHFDMIITSPPYANTYDYYLYHKFRKFWLDLDVRYAQYNEIGSRREFSSLKNHPDKWIADLKKCFSEMNRVLKSKRIAFVVIGDSVIQKNLIKMDEVIKHIAPETNFIVREMFSSDLSNHSKLFNPNFAQKGKKEHIILLEKLNG